jgi:vacuolar protein sorting-associated protein 72
MANDEDTNPQSPTSSTSSTSSSRSSTVIPEALVHGREKRATAGNKLRALLDAEFQEEEIFKEDENDEEFERQKSEEGEDFLTDSESSDNEEIQDEEEGERALLAQQKSEAKKSRERKRKANEAFSKPAAKRRVPPTKENVVISKAASTASSVSNRRISFDPTLLSSRRSSRALTVQTTNETHSRIISAAARRATLPVIPRREQTPPLTQEERLAQAVLTEQENKLSLKRIVEAEEERARKRREKLEALRRRRFDSPILRFISRRQPLIEEIPANDEDIVVVDDVDEKEEPHREIEVKQEPMDGVIGEVAKDKQEAKEGDELVTDIPNDQGPDINLDKSAAGQGTTSNHEAKNTTAGSADTPPTAQSKQQSPVSDGNKSVNPPALAEQKMDNDQVVSNNAEPAKTITDKSATPVPPQTNPSTSDIQQHSDSMQDIKTNDEAEVKTISPAANGTGAPEVMKDANEVSRPTEPLSETHLHESHTDQTTPPPAISPSTPKSSPKVTQPQTPPPPKSPPPYHEANYTANTLSFVPLPGAPLHSTRETFFPDVPVIPPPKPKPSARCPITGLPARYKDPLSGVGYYDIHAFKILREVGRKGGRYVWCSEGGWFVGETGWGGRAAKGVPEGWNG